MNTSKLKTNSKDQDNIEFSCDSTYSEAVAIYAKMLIVILLAIYIPTQSSE